MQEGWIIAQEVHRVGFSILIGSGGDASNSFLPAPRATSGFSILIGSGGDASAAFAESGAGSFRFSILIGSGGDARRIL